MLQPNDEFLFTRQRHEAERMGLHYDLRAVIGDKAYSWATKKDMPEPGKMIAVFEQPVHDRAYALSEKVVIPTGQYGAGTTYLDWVRKAKVSSDSTPNKLVIYTKDGSKYLIKRSPGKWGNTAWLFRNITGMGEDTNPFVEKAKEMEKKASAGGDSAHHAAALKKLQEQKGILVNHSLGSGKTKLMLRAIENQLKANKEGRALVIAPASLTTNIDKEIKKHKIKIDRSRLDVHSYEKAVNIADELAKNKYLIAAVDESQKLRNSGSKRTKTLRDIIGSSDQRLLATATATYNHLADIAPIINIASGNEDILPESRKDMEDRYTETREVKPGFVDKLMGKGSEEEVNLKNKKALGEILGQYVHYYDSADDPEMKKFFPKISEKNVEVEMSPEQHKYYRYAEGKLPLMLRFKIRHNMPLDKKEKAQINSFSTGVRQISTGYRHYHEEGKGEYTPKVKKAVESLIEGHKTDKNFKALVYSNYIDAGLKEYSKMLTDKKVAHAIYDGSLSKTEKDKLVEDYNKGKLKTLLISSSGGEGLNTFGTKRVQILEPHWNKSKIKQVVGRASRFKSHEHLPEEERTVDVEHFLSTHPKPLFGKAPTSIDQYLSSNSDDKQDLFDQVKGLMKKHST
ncbi:hypothetical protein D3C87_279920 [compost metagenome]